MALHLTRQLRATINITGILNQASILCGELQRTCTSDSHLKISRWVDIHCSSTLRGGSSGDVSRASAWSMLMSPTHAAAKASRAARPKVSVRTCLLTSAICRASEYLHHMSPIISAFSTAVHFQQPTDQHKSALLCACTSCRHSTPHHGIP